MSNYSAKFDTARFGYSYFNAIFQTYNTDTILSKISTSNQFDFNILTSKSRLEDFLTYVSLLKSNSGLNYNLDIITGGSNSKTYDFSSLLSSQDLLDRYISSIVLQKLIGNLDLNSDVILKQLRESNYDSDILISSLNKLKEMDISSLVSAKIDKQELFDVLISSLDVSTSNVIDTMTQTGISEEIIMNAILEYFDRESDISFSSVIQSRMTISELLDIILLSLREKELDFNTILTELNIDRQALINFIAELQDILKDYNITATITSNNISLLYALNIIVERLVRTDYDFSVLLTGAEIEQYLSFNTLTKKQEYLLSRINILISKVRENEEVFNALLSASGLTREYIANALIELKDKISSFDINTLIKMKDLIVPQLISIYIIREELEIVESVNTIISKLNLKKETLFDSLLLLSNQTDVSISSVLSRLFDEHIIINALVEQLNLPVSLVCNVIIGTANISTLDFNVLLGKRNLREYILNLIISKLIQEKINFNTILNNMNLSMNYIISTLSKYLNIEEDLLLDILTKTTEETEIDFSMLISHLNLSATEQFNIILELLKHFQLDFNTFLKSFNNINEMSFDIILSLLISSRDYVIDLVVRSLMSIGYPLDTFLESSNILPFDFNSSFLTTNTFNYEYLSTLLKVSEISSNLDAKIGLYGHTSYLVFTYLFGSSLAQYSLNLNIFRYTFIDTATPSSSPIMSIHGSMSPLMSASLSYVGAN